MQWSAIVGILIFIVFAGTVQGILAFSFCSIVAFVFARYLLDGENQLDFTRFFVSKGLRWHKERETASTIRRPFPRGLKKCRHALVRNILRDFVIAWYENVGIDGQFILQTRSLLEEATVNFYDKLSRTSVSCHTQKLCILLHRHLATVKAAKLSMTKNHKSFVESYRSLQNENRARQNDELQYLRNVIDLLLYKLIVPKTLGCDTGRFILREILAYKLLLPLLDKISEPDFLNTSIINIFGEDTDENLVMSSLVIDEPQKSNLKISTSFVQYLNENLELNNSGNANNSGKLVQGESATKYKFKDTTVVEKYHSDVIELSVESDNSVRLEKLEQGDSTECRKADLKTDAETVHKTKESDISMKPQNTTKDTVHSSGIINGLTRVKNDLLKPKKEKGHNSKFNAILSAKISSSGNVFAKQLRKIHSSPVMQQSYTSNMDKSFPKKGMTSDNIHDSVEVTDLSKRDNEFSPCFHHRSASFNLEDHNVETGSFPSQSMPKLISGDVLSSSFEDIDVDENDVGDVENVSYPNSQNPSKDPKTHELPKFDITSSDDQPQSSQADSNYQPRRQYTISSSSTEDWDSEGYERMEDKILFENGDDIFETEGVSLKTQHPEDDIVSRADFAINDVCNPCLMIEIPTTELITDHSFEPYKSRYTVYVIMYDRKLWQPQLENDDQPVELEGSEADNMKGCIKRRYREFMELHHRLVCGPFSSLMKEIPRPNRKFNSPFFRLDQDVVEGRQILLESYLKCLVSKSAILNSEDFKGFLGIGDESHTDFRRHISVVPTLPNVPRIDKKLQKKVTKFLDHIKTAINTGPVDGDKEEEYEDIRQVLGEDKTSQDDIRTFAVCSGGCKTNDSCCHSEHCFQTYIEQQQHNNDDVDQPSSRHSLPETVRQRKTSADRLNSKNTCTGNGHVSKGLKLRKHSMENSNVLAKEGINGSIPEQETNPLTKTVLNLSCHLLEKHESWLCSEPVQQAATAVLGYFLEWWMDETLSELVTEEQWQHYLMLLTDTVWPGGELMSSVQQSKSEDEKLKTKEEAIQTLSNFFGVILHTTVGTDALQSSAKEIVESLQYAEINRQLLMELLEVILVEIFPELIHERDFYLSSRNC